MRLTNASTHEARSDVTIREILSRLAAYEDTGYSPAEIKSLESEWNAAREVVDFYRNAEEQGLLVRLPCKVGDTVYKLWYAPCRNGETYPDGAGCDGCFDKCDIHKEITEFTVPNVNFIWVNFVMKGNTTYYLTRSEAQAALKEETDNGTT